MIGYSMENLVSRNASSCRLIASNLDVGGTFAFRACVAQWQIQIERRVPEWRRESARGA